MRDQPSDREGVGTAVPELEAAQRATSLPPLCSSLVQEPFTDTQVQSYSYRRWVRNIRKISVVPSIRIRSGELLTQLDRSEAK
jgi:hypothetical protein